MNALRFGRRAVGTSLLCTGLTWTVWQIVDTSHGCPPLAAWVLVSVVGFILVRDRKKRTNAG